jgi:hypothetical protein
MFYLFAGADPLLRRSMRTRQVVVQPPCCDRGLASRAIAARRASVVMNAKSRDIGLAAAKRRRKLGRSRRTVTAPRKA